MFMIKFVYKASVRLCKWLGVILWCILKLHGGSRGMHVPLWIFSC